MALGRQRYHTGGKVCRRHREWKYIATYPFQRRKNFFSLDSDEKLPLSMRECIHQKKEKRRILSRSKNSSLISFESAFREMSDSECCHLFHFRKTDVLRIVAFVGWPATRCKTSRNQYETSPLLFTCVLLCLLSTAMLWHDVELLFAKHFSQISEIFWETLEHFLKIRVHLLTGEMSSQWLTENAQRYASAITECGGTLQLCVVFIDGTAIGIARPRDKEMQRAAYNGHKGSTRLNFKL